MAIPEHSGIFELIAGNSWLVTDDDCVLIFQGTSLQCNRNPTITERLANISWYPSAVSVRVIDRVFIPITSDCDYPKDWLSQFKAIEITK